MLEEKILNDYKEAMKARDNLKSSVLSCLRADFINAAIARKKSALDDSECFAVIKKQVKQHQDSVEQFRKGSRNDLAEKEEKELRILESYLPKQLSEPELKIIIEEAVGLTAASGIKDMGRVMKEVAARVQAAADGRLISDLVKKRLSQP